MREQLQLIVNVNIFCLFHTSDLARSGPEGYDTTVRVQGGPSGRGKPPVDLVPALSAAAGPLLYKESLKNPYQIG